MKGAKFMCLNRYTNHICAIMTVISILITIGMLNGQSLGLQSADTAAGYESRLFDTEKVHELEIIMDQWDGFLEACEDEAYSPCSVIIDGERLDNVGIRAKGNTSLSNVRMMNSKRYSLKIEFDHYEAGESYHGLDKLCLNNLIQDNTYMKDYLSYRMMDEFGVDAPLCSYVHINVNGESWGLFLAVEGVEESFLKRNYEDASGALYKPDHAGFGGGGPGNGRNFRMEDIQGGPPEMGMGMPPGPPPGPGMGSSDIMLQYSDDDPNSYANIFGNAKTHVTKADQLRLIRSLKALSEQKNLEQILDLEEVLRYFVVHNYTVNGDSYTGGMIHNYYLYERNGQLSMIPWDYNLAFGSFQSRSASEAVNDPLDAPLSVSGDGTRPMAEWMLTGEYLNLYHERFEEFLDKVDVQKILSDAYDLISDYATLKPADPTAFCTREQFEEGVKTLRAFCQLRSQSLREQLNASSTSGQGTGNPTLIDASSLNLSAMGTMGGPGGPPPGPDMRGFPGAPGNMP